MLPHKRFRSSFALGLALGALAFPLGYNLGCRITGRHHLSIKENP